MEWPYENIDYNELDTAIKTCEKMIVSLGGKPVTKCMDKETWILNKDDYIVEPVSKGVYRFRDSYVCVDKMYFPEKPFIVLEFGDEIEGIYEDADPFPFDLTMEEMKLEIQWALGVVPYPCWQKKAIIEKLIPQYAALMAWNGRYAIYNEYEYAFLLDIQNKQTYQLGDYYGDPELALIDKQEAFVVVIGVDHLGVFDLTDKELKLMDIDIPEWIVSLNQEGRKIEAICENDMRYVFEI